MKKFGLIKGSNAVKAEELVNERKEVDTMEMMSEAQTQGAEATPQAPAAPETAATPKVASPEKIGLWQRVKNVAVNVGQKAGKVVSTTCKVVGAVAIVGGAAYGISKLRSHNGQDEPEIIPENDEDSSYSEVSSEDDDKES